MNVLVVGGAGYIGGAVVDLLLESNHDVLVYDSLVFEESYRKDVEFVCGDIRDTEKLMVFLAKADCVIWLAAIVGDGACAVDPATTKIVNQDMVEWLSKNYDGRIIFMSTCSVYGASDGILDENSKTNPLSVYAETKLQAESFLKDKNALIFRLGTLFGVGDYLSRIRLDLVVNTMTARAVSEGSLKVFGGDQWRPLLHVQDVADTIVENIATKNTGTFNLHYENMKMIDLAQQVSKLTGAKVDIVETPFEDNRNYRVNSNKAINELGFLPLFDLNDGIQEVATLIQAGRIKDLNNPRYSNQRFMEMFHGTN